MWPPTTASGFATPKPCTRPTSTAPANSSAWPVMPRFRASSTRRPLPPCTFAPMGWSSTRTRRCRSKTWWATTSGRSLAEQEAIKAAQSGQQVDHPQSHHAHRPQRRQAHAYRPHLCGFLNGKFPAYMDTGLNLVDVAEVARTHVTALTMGTARPPLHSGRGEPDPQADSRQDVGIPAFRRPPSRFPSPSPPPMRFRRMDHRPNPGQEPRATLEEVRMGRKKMYASSAHAQQELGFRNLPVYPAMRAAIEWFRANGFAP